MTPGSPNIQTGNAGQSPILRKKLLFECEFTEFPWCMETGTFCRIERGVPVVVLVFRVAALDAVTVDAPHVAVLRRTGFSQPHLVKREIGRAHV